MSVASITARNEARRARGEHRTYDVRAALAQSAAPPPAPALVPLHLLPECVSGGTDRDITEQCMTCAGPGRHVRECEVYTRVTWEPQPDMRTAMTCRECRTLGKGYRPAPDPRTLRPRVTVVDPDRLAEPGQRRFNCSLLNTNRGPLLAYRAGWEYSRIHLATLGPDLQPTATAPLALSHPLCEGGAEDPRLFDHNGRPWLWFAGVVRKGVEFHVSQLVAPLADDLTAERVTAPHYTGRAYPVEKNWSPFSRGGSLFCLYSVRPWKVLALSESGAVATGEFVGPAPGPDKWAGWELRGGAPPVRVGDEFVTFFHGWRKTPNTRTPSGDWYDYAAGVLTFDAAPPFAFRRICPYPVWLADPRREDRNITRDKTVIYPSGATFDGARWLVSAGQHDTDCLIAEFTKDEIETALKG